MDAGILIITLALGAGVGFLIFRAWEYSNWDKGMTLKDLQRKHPKSFINDKFMACPICDSKVLRIMKYRKGALKKYMCKDCGRELWRTKE